MGFKERASGIKLLALDVDGVLTDGRLYYGADGEALKVFQVKDGSAIKRLMASGIKVCVITAKSGPALVARMADLSIEHYFLGVKDKLSVLKKVCEGFSIALEEACYVGDDALDLACLASEVLSVCPKDAHPPLKGICDFVTTAKGGEGVVAELEPYFLASKASLQEEDFHVVIPARWGSTRFPGKPLSMIKGRPMIEWVYERAKQSKAKSVLVATDDSRIEKACEGFGAKVYMTSSECASGTDRIGEVLQKLSFDKEAIVVNVQGDEPTIDPLYIDKVAFSLMTHKDCQMATLAAPFDDLSQVKNPHLVKVVRDKTGAGIYFSRALIPYDAKGVLHKESYLRHIGIYAYRAKHLERFVAAGPCPLERAESLEQLRALWLSMRIMVETIEGGVPVGVDTPEDLLALEQDDRALSSGV